MVASVVRSDLEGVLVRFKDGAAEHYAKSLSTDVGWHTFEPRALVDALPAAVQSVDTDFTAGTHAIHYAAGIEPLDLLTLRESLHHGGPLALWRAATLAIGICEQLEALHDADFPQLLVHPSRVGRAEGKFTLLPTLAGVLPPLADVFANMSDGWVHYIAPEVLRTRAMQKAMLFAGDVYSFGRMLEALCVTARAGDGVTDPFEVAARRVELLDRDEFGELPEAFGGLRGLLGRMRAPLPEQRPLLGEVRRELESLARDHAPAVLFARHQQAGDFAAAQHVFRELEEDETHHGVDDRAFRIMTADVALMETPPDCNRAVLELDRAEAPKVYEPDIQFRMGRAYALWTSLPRHLVLSSQAYERAAGLADWSPEVLDEWAVVLASGGDPTAALAATADVPSSRRTRQLAAVRTRALAAIGDAAGAWNEVTSAFPLFSFDQQLYDLALEAAARIAPPVLVLWCDEHIDEPGMAAGLAAAFRTTGHPDFAQLFLERAFAWQPERS